MPPTNNSDSSITGVSPESKTESHFFFGALGLAVALGALAYFFLPYIWTAYAPVITNGVENIQQKVVDGTIVLTLAAKTGGMPGIYTYDVAERALTPYYVRDGQGNMTASLVPGGAVFASDGSASAENRARGLLQIVRYTEEGKTLETVTSSEATYKRHPLWSKVLNAVVYSAKDSVGKGMGSVDDYSVYLVKSGVETKVGAGAMPKLLPDGKTVVVLRSDGLYTMDLETGGAVNIWPILKGKAGLAYQFDVSPLGDAIAWSNPYEGTITILQANSWSPFSGAVVKEIKAYASWPVFSPSGRELAFVEREGKDISTKQQLSLFSFAEGEKQVIMSLDEYAALSVFISDWK